MASNDRTLDDGDGRASDWIEIYNAGDDEMDLAEWHLTDNPNRPDRWTFPPYRLGPGEYLVVFASGRESGNYTDFEGHLHTNFKLAKNGEYLALTDNNNVVVQAFAPAFPQQFTDISYGIGGTDTDRYYFQQPTPGNANALGFGDVTEDEVVFSRGAGTFMDEFSLILSSKGPESSVYYTTDGTLPDENSHLYTGPFTIGSTTQVRARVIQPNRVPGPVNTESYIRLGADVIGFTSQLPIMVIDNFDAGPIPNRRLNINNAEADPLFRQPAHLMLFENDHGATKLTGRAALESRIGIRVRGTASATFPEPGYSVEAWGDAINDDTDIAPFGMSPESNWVLYAPSPIRDVSLIHNTFAFTLSRQIGHWATDFRYVEAFLNTDGGDLTISDFVGLYVIEERVDRQRLGFEKFSVDATSGGWLLEINRRDNRLADGELPKNFHTPGPDGVLETPPDLIRGDGLGDDIPRTPAAHINFDDPSGGAINAVQRQAIERWMRQMEAVLYGRADVSWNDPVNGYSKYINVDSFIDYFIVENLSKNDDALEYSMWLYNPDPNGEGKLTFGPVWDNDFAYIGSPSDDLMHRANLLWYDRLFEDADFLQAYIDRWQTLRDGPLSAANIEDIVDDLFTQIGSQAAINDEVFDWPLRLDILKAWVLNRAAAIDRTLVSRPRFNTANTVIPTGFSLSISAEQGTIYYTTDGSDPRIHGGSVSPAAAVFDGPFEVMQRMTVKARSFDNGEWSGITDAEFLMASDLPLRISEVNYHPHKSTPNEENFNAGQFEFVELMNVGQRAVDLAGVQLVGTNVSDDQEGIVFEFASHMLDPGERIAVVRDHEAFRARYGITASVADGSGGPGANHVFRGDLADLGVRLTLTDSDGKAIQQFSYFSGNGWPDRADGQGSTLEVIDVFGDYNSAENWKASSHYGGSPGAADDGLEGQIVISEILVSPNDAEDDYVELHNTTGRDVDVTGWYVSNSSRDLLKARIIRPTTIPAGGYHVLNTTELGIALDGVLGGEVFITTADGNGAVHTFIDEVRYGVSDLGSSVGPSSTRDNRFVPLDVPTLAAPNSGPSIGDIVISEISYAPDDLDGANLLPVEDFAYIELHNRTSDPIDLGGWQLTGNIRVSFAPGTVIDGDDFLTVVPFNAKSGPVATVFRFLYTMPPNAPLVGLDFGSLGTDSGVVRLIRPANFTVESPNITPMVIVDEVQYESVAPWPVLATGTGESLHRIDPNSLGSKAINWRTGPPSPGNEHFITRNIGDSNDDGRFDQLDITLILHAGKYNTGHAATFGEGDWNGDGLFDQSDIILALTTSSYEWIR